MCLSKILTVEVEELGCRPKGKAVPWHWVDFFPRVETSRLTFKELALPASKEMLVSSREVILKLNWFYFVKNNMYKLQKFSLKLYHRRNEGVSEPFLGGFGGGGFLLAAGEGTNHRVATSRA